MFSITRPFRLFRPAALVAALLFCSPLAAQTTPETQTPPASPAPPAATTTPQAADPLASGDASSGMAVQLQARPALVFSGAGEWDDGLRAIMEAFDRLRDELGKAGWQPGGRPIAIFTDTDDKGFRFNAMIPLVAAPEGAAPAFGEGVKLGATPVGKAVKFEHRGSYDDIDSTYEAITAWLDEKGLEAQNLFVEEYLSMPKSADDQDLEIDIYVFIK